ncbi:MAG: GNAT family N-acetyltransferase [Filomicrobium sp.]
MQAVQPVKLGLMREAIHTSERCTPSISLRSELRFELVGEVGSLGTLSVDWARLIEHARGPSLQFQSLAFIQHWLSHFEASDVVVLLGYRGGELVMAWPMVRESRFGLKVLRWLGDPVAQYGDAIVRDGPDADRWLELGLEHLKAHGKADLIQFDRLRADGALAPVMRATGLAPTQSETAMAIDLTAFPTMEKFRSRFSGKTRRARRRHRTLLEERGALKFCVHTGGDKAVPAVKKAMDFKAEWLTLRGQISRAFLDDRFESFWIDLARSETSGKTLLVSEFSCGGEIIAVEIGLRSGQHYIAHVGAFDPAYQDFGPGALQMEETIAYLHGLGVETYDLLPPSDGYKKRWADTEIDVADYTLANSALGQAYLAFGLQSLKDELKSRFHQLPPGLRRSLATVLPMIAGRK